jgi:hypothetical protein
MNKRICAALVIATVATPIVLTAPAQAQHRDRDRDRDHRWDGDRDGWEPSDRYDNNRRYKARKLSRDDRVYRGKDGRYYCRRNDGTTGLVVGALAGGVLGNVVGGGTLGTLAGAAGGGLLGRSVDRGKVKCR